jgi:putative ABC transport system permease protein
MSRGTRGRTVYAAFVRLYPRDFRDRFGPEMLALFEERAAAAPRTLAGRAAFWWTMIVDVFKGAARERFPDASMHESCYDLRQAWRRVARAPMLTTFVVALMALSIGSTTAAFSVVHGVLLRPLPFPDPDRLVLIWEWRSPENPRNNVGAHEYPEWRAQNRSFAEMAAIAYDREYNLTGAGEPVKLTAVRVTSGFFPVMGVTPIAGRGFTADEDRPGNGSVVVIAEHLWRARLGSDPSVVGRPLQLNNVPHTIVGVMPASFQFPPGAGGVVPDIWTPIAEPIQLYRGRHYLTIVGRLRPGVTIAQAQSDLEGIARGVEKAMPQFSGGHGVSVQRLHGELVRDVRRALLVVFAAVALVLIIGCCNVANLLLAGAAERQQEVAVRVALGAGRFRVARQLLAEGGLLAALGGGAGLLLASWLIGLARSSAAPDVPRLQTVSLDPAVLLFAVALTVMTALVFGLVPLASLMRVEVAERLKHGSKGVARPSRQPLRRVLVIAEVALTVVIAAGASLFLQSFYRLIRVDPGFRTAGIVTADVALPPSKYRSPMDQRRFFEEALARVRRLPGVAGVAATNIVPQSSGRSGIAVAVEGRVAATPGEQLAAAFRVVSTDYFKTLDIPIVAGRAFAAQDARVAVPLIRWFPQQPRPPRFDEPQPPPVAVVNQEMARQFWPGRDPIGRRFTVLSSPPITVIGIAQNSRNHALADAAEPEFYLSDGQEPQSTMTLLVHATSAMGLLPAAIRSEVWAIDRDLPVSNVRTLAEVVDGNLALHRSMTELMGGFAAMALMLMALGVYAVVSYTTAQRTFEIGVRMALGAQRSDIRQLVVVNGVGLTAAGITIGLGGAYALGRFASNMLYEVTPSDPLTYLALTTLVLGITMLATWAPARRAQRVNPVTVLRNE